MPLQDTPSLKKYGSVKFYPPPHESFAGLQLALFLLTPPRFLLSSCFSFGQVFCQFSLQFQKALSLANACLLSPSKNHKTNKRHERNSGSTIAFILVLSDQKINKLSVFCVLDVLKKYDGLSKRSISEKGLKKITNRERLQFNCN